MKAPAQFIKAITAISIIPLFTGLVIAGDFTLSDEGLMMLKETNKHVIAKSSIVEKRDRPGSGVELDIYFPGTKFGENIFECVATKWDDPNNPLLTSDLSVYDAFALKFTLLAINGDPTPRHTGQLVVGAYINNCYRPECVTLDPCVSSFAGYTNTAISRTQVGSREVSNIGVTMHMLSAEEWDPNGTTITLLIEAAPGAAVIPKTAERRPSSNTGRVIYVDAGSKGNNDGSNWENAFRYLQDALATASRDNQIWVAKGIYRPNEGRQPAGKERTATFILKNGISIFGGFPSGGGKWEDGNPIVNETILSGDLKGDDVTVDNTAKLSGDTSRIDNAFHVVTASGVDETAILDGFIITAGNASGVQYDTTSQGGGLYGKAGSPNISNCIFKLNSAESGGAIYFWKGNGRFINCRFIGNYAGDGGGAIHNTESSPTIVNCVFTRNMAVEKGGAIYNETGRAKIINCTITKNYAYAGGGMYNQKSTPTLANCIFWGNTSRYGIDEPAQVYGVKVEASNCCIQGLTEQFGGKNCMASDPQITDIEGDGCRLSTGSPCINSGDNTAIPNDIGTDMEGNPRILGNSVDIGAIEVR